MTPHSHLDIINIADNLEVTALRALLENWGVVTRVWHMASASDLVYLLNGQIVLSEIIVISCHGGSKGLHLPELAPEVAAQQPYSGVINAAQMREFLKLPSKLVINTGCKLGCPEFAQAFLDAGCHAYIGSNDYIEGDASLLYLSIFFYEHLCKGKTLEAAHLRASEHDEETQLFQLFQ